jgi:hypothetical protein
MACTLLIEPQSGQGGKRMGFLDEKFSDGRVNMFVTLADGG